MKQSFMTININNRRLKHWQNTKDIYSKMALYCVWVSAIRMQKTEILHLFKRFQTILSYCGLDETMGITI